MYFYFACIALWMRFTAFTPSSTSLIRGEGDARAFRFRACARARGLMARAAGAACVVRADPTGRDRSRRCGDRIEFEI